MTNQLIYVDDTTDGICGNAGITVDNGTLINSNDWQNNGYVLIGNNNYLFQNGNAEFNGYTYINDLTIKGHTDFHKSIKRAVTGYGNNDDDVHIDNHYYYVSLGNKSGGYTKYVSLDDGIPGHEIFIQCNSVSNYNRVWLYPYNLYDVDGISFEEDNSYVHLIWTSGHWRILDSRDISIFYDQHHKQE